MADLASLRINVDSRGVRDAISDLAGLSRGADNAGRSSSNLATAMQTLTRSLAALGIGAIVVEMIKFGAQFEKSITEISTLVDTTIVSVDELSAAVRNQATAFGGDVQTQAKALYQIISAGASDAATANNILTTANKLAVGGVTDVATAADGLTSVLNAYGDKVAGATAVSDAMFVAMKAGKTTIGELSASIGGVAPLAAQMGISFDELAASTAALTKGGVSTSVAMTGLRAILATIAKPSKEATDLAAELGIQFNSAGLQAKGLAGFMEDLKQKTGGNSDAMATLFGGVEALVPALALAGKAGEDLAVIMGQMAAKSGASDEAFGKMARTFDFQFAKAIANINDRILSLGLLIQSTLLPVLTFFNNNLNEIQRTLQMVAFSIGGAVAAFFALKVAMGIQAIIGFIVQIYALIAGMGIANFATVAATFALNAFKVALASTGIGLVVVAIGALIGAMYSLGTAQSSARAETEKLTGSLRGLAAARSADFQSQLVLAKQNLVTDANTVKKLSDETKAMEERVQSAGMHGTFLRNEINKNNAILKEKTANLKADTSAVVESQSIYTAAGKAAAAQAQAEAQGAAISTAATSDKTKETKKATDALMDYYTGLVETGRYLGFSTEYEKQAAKATADGRVELAAKIIMQGKANEAAQLLIDNEKKRQDFIKGTLADLLFENTLIGKNTQERQQAIAVRALENAMLASTSVEYQKYLAAVAAGSEGKILDDQQKRIAALREEIELMGLAPAAAAERAAVLEAERLGLEANTQAYKDFIAAAAQQAGLEKTRDGLKEIKDAMQEVKDMTFDIDLEGVFGNVGKAVGGLVNVYDDFAKRQKTLDIASKGYAKGSVERSQAELKSFRNQINLYGNLASSAKGFFKEKSTGYKLMQAAETAFRAFEFAMSIKSMAMQTAEAGVTVATEGTKTAAQTASGASKIFSQLGWWAFPVVAAMIAVMASLGGKGGSVSQPSIPSAEDMQATQGTGSVLGDATAKSDSINKALEIMAKNSNSDLEYSNQMLTSLRSIQNSMADLSNNVAKQISVSGSMFDTSGQRLGSSGSGGFLGIGKTSTTRELQDLGIDIVSTTIAEIIAGGISGSTYQVIEQVKKKSGFLGIGGGTKTTYQTTTGNIDQDVRNSITGVIASLRQGLIDGADVIGLDGAQAILDSFQVNIGRISLAGLSGSEIEEQLNAVFSKVGDEMAGALFPALTEMQRISEGLFETFARVAREYQVVDVTLASIGKEFGAVGVSSLAARSALVQMFESLDQFVEQTNFFRDNFLTEAERIAPVTQAVAAELERLGLSSITTIDQFKNAVLGLDLTSASGQETYAALLQLAPAFKMVADYQAEIAKLQVASAEAGIDTAKINAENAKAALEIQQKRVSMEIQLLEAQGFASEALAIRRRLELAAMDESLRALQEQIYAAQDAATAARDAKAASDAAAQVAKAAADEALKLTTQRTNLEITLMEELGDASGALAARRAMELSAMDATLRAIQQQIYAQQDAAKAAQEAARDAAEQVNLEIQLMEAQGNAAGALAARRQLELAAMNETLGALQAQIYAAQDLQASIEAASRAAQQAADQAAGIARERTNLEIQLMEEQGDAAGALAARRALELAALDESNRAIQEQIYIQQDANNRAAELAAAREAAQQRAEAARAKAEQELEARLAAAAQLANDRRQLEIQLMELQGKTSEALAARRAIELAGIDASLRALQQQIYAAEDARDASIAAAEAAAAAAEEQARLADEALALARDRRSLEIELMEALGNSSGALAAQREIELAGMDATLRGLQLQIYAANDAREASLAAAEAAAQAAQEQERLAEEAFALAQNRRSLEIELLDAQGFAVEALALRRAMELEAMDASLRGIQMQIWAALAQAEANELAAQVAQDAAEAQAKAAEDAAKALQDYSDALANVSQTVIDEINRLRGISATSSSSLLKAQFATLTAQARTGNLDALGKLPELSRSIEEATLGTATSALEVARIRAWLASSLSETLGMQAVSGNMVNATSSALTFDGNGTASANAEQTSGELSNMSNVLYNALYQVARNTGKSYELLDRWDGDGLPDIREDASDYY